MDVVSLSQSAIAYLTPYLLHAAGKTVEEGLDMGREKLFQWLQAKFLSISQKDALVRAQELPEDEEVLETLRSQLERAMKKNPAFMEEIRDLLPEEKRKTGIEQHISCNGNNNVTIQVAGKGNWVQR